jgi:hypothetical protein
MHCTLFIQCIDHNKFIKMHEEMHIFMFTQLIYIKYNGNSHMFRFLMDHLHGVCMICLYDALRKYFINC